MILIKTNRNSPCINDYFSLQKNNNNIICILRAIKILFF